MDVVARSAADPLNEVLAQLGERVAPLTLARERIIPIAEPLRGLFPEGGIVRGRVVTCRGEASSSIAFSLVRDAMVEGAWLAVIDVASFGADAAVELGVPLERVVRVSTTDVASPETQVADWVDVMGAAIDGFDLVLTRVPAALRRERPPASVRKLSSRLQQRGAVVVVLGDSGGFPNDITVASTRSVWSGLGRGSGHLRRRRLHLEASGRRQPAPRECSIEFVGGRRHVELVADRDPAGERVLVADRDLADRDLADRDLVVAGDPQEQVLAEMRAAARNTATVPHDHLEAG